MRRRCVTILAVISLALLGILFCGYVSACQLWFERCDANGETATFRRCYVTLDRGAWTIIRQEFPATLELVPKVPPGFHFSGLSKLIMPKLRDSLWGFDLNTSKSPSGQSFVLRGPIWWLALPCTIAPILWLRRRRRAKRRGFPMEEPRADLQNQPAA